jgi:hypothetical protein
MEAAPDTGTPAAPAPRQGANSIDTQEYKDYVCSKIKSEIFLTPPGVIDALCEDRPIYDLCPKTVYVEEALELARRLGRAHLLNFDADC